MGKVNPQFAFILAFKRRLRRSLAGNKRAMLSPCEIDYVLMHMEALALKHDFDERNAFLTTTYRESGVGEK